jgi:ankyrin repeat protein
MQPYVVLGHGVENTRVVRPVVPAGCALVLTEECGMLGTIPHHIYEVLAKPENAAVFADPVLRQGEVERLLRRPIRIYTAGEHYPVLTYTLLSYSEDYKKVSPSGLYAVPTPDFVFQPTKRGDDRYMLPAREVQRTFAGAVVPSAAPPAAPLEALEQNPALKKTQAALFSAKPGVHYSLLCRAVPEEDRLRELIEQAFPEVDLDELFGKEATDFFQTAAHWLASIPEEQLRPKNRRLAAAEIRQIIEGVMTKRKASGSPLGEPQIESLMALLTMKNPPREALMTAITALDNTERGERHFGRTPLMLAAFMGHGEAVTALLARGANVNARDQEGTTPLIFGCSSGDLAICEALLDAGADPRLMSEDRVNPLSIACGTESLRGLVPRLLAAGADPTVLDNDQDTALHTAASYNFAELVPVLLGAGAPLNSQNEDGKTPLMLAAEEGADAALQALLAAGADVSIKTAKGISALALAVGNKKDTTAVLLVNVGSPVSSWKKLHTLAIAKGLPQLAALVERRASSSNRRRTGRKGTEKLRVTHRRTSSYH